MSRIDRPPFQSQSGKLYKSNNRPINVADSFDQFGNLKVAEYTPFVEAKPLPILDWVRNRFVPAANQADFSVVSGEIQIDATLGKRTLYTRKHGRYLPGLIGLAGIGVRLETVNTGQYEFGYGNATNRIGVELDNGQWYTFVESEGVRYNRNPRSNWEDPLDGTGPSSIDIDAIQSTKFVLRIFIGWYGYTPIQFQLVIGDQVVIIDTLRGDNLNGVSIAQPDLPIFAEANGGIMHVGGRQYGVYGRYVPAERTTPLPVVTKTVSDTAAWKPVISFRIKQLIDYLGVPVNLSSLVGFIDTNVEYAFFMHDLSLLTGPSWQNVPDTTADGTVIEYDTTATALADGGYNLYSTIAAGGKGNELTPLPNELPDIDIAPDLVVTLAARSLATSTVFTAKVRLQEEW